MAHYNHTVRESDISRQGNRIKMFFPDFDFNPVIS